MKVALAQIDSASGDVQANLERHIDYIQKSIDAGADLIVFPELSLSGETLGPEAEDASLSADSATIKAICEPSQEIDIVVGVNERSETSLYDRYNAAFYFSERTLVHRHRKLFLVNYAVFEEAKHYAPGYNLQAFDTRIGRVCMLVCNDVWHSPSPYIAALDGAEILIVPANSARGTLKDRLDIPSSWEHMNRAYSAMLGFYTIFVNRVGTRRDMYGEYPYWGGSEIIDAQGQVVVKAPYDEEALIFGEIDTAEVSLQRYRVPLVRDARLWLYQQEIDRLAVKRSEAVRLPDTEKVLEATKPDSEPARRVGD
jgi:predicted amidohydrolase